MQNHTDNKKTVVLVGGCFDLLHFGHISFLREAKEYGNHLIVLLESDENVRMLKGEGRPIHTQDQRKYMLESLSCVDEVFLLPPIEGNDAYNRLIMMIRPDVIACTEGDPFAETKRKQAEERGGRLVIIPKITSPSTSKLVKLLELE